MKLSQFYQDIFSQLTKKVPLKIEFDYFKNINHLDGLPVITREFEGTKIINMTVVKKMEKKQFDKGNFLPPPSYKQKTMMR